MLLLFSVDKISKETISMAYKEINLLKLTFRNYSTLKQRYKFTQYTTTKIFAILYYIS